MIVGMEAPVRKMDRKRWTWEALVAIEPRLAALERLARAGGDWRNYEIWKSRLKRLVGWDSENPELQSMDAYDVAHAHLLLIFEGKR